MQILLVILLLAITLASPAPVCKSAERALQPNIVLILCDDLGYGDVQCLNPLHGKIPTPSVDKLAAAGMIFIDAHSG